MIKGTAHLSNRMPRTLWQKALIKLFTLTGLLIGLPLLGITLAGKPIAPYLQFPPIPAPTEHEPFSWSLFILLSAFTLLIIGTMIFILGPWEKTAPSPIRQRPFPRWGWLALSWLGLTWLLAWTRPEWAQNLQSQKFTLLWLGYIGVINALTCWRSGTCLLRNQPLFLFALFPFSALFWWYFEYLNRFVQNWHYLGTQDYTAFSYILQATLPFATVLPAVVSTNELLQTFPRLRRSRLKAPLVIQHPRRWAWLALALACLGLVGIGLWPDRLYSLLWLAPLLIFVSMQALQGEKTYFAALGEGRWEKVIVPMLAALLCGFFWEMWNYFSYPKWIYSIPYVYRFKIFEMPLLGYAGYLPFGLECIVIADFVKRLLPSVRFLPNRK